MVVTLFSPIPRLFSLVSLISIISSYLALCFLFFTQNIDFTVVGIPFFFSFDAPALHRSTYVRSGALTKRKMYLKIDTQVKLLSNHYLFIVIY